MLQQGERQCKKKRKTVCKVAAVEGMVH